MKKESIMDQKKWIDEFCDIMSILSKKRIHQDTTDNGKGEIGVLISLTLCEDGLTSGELKEKIGVGSGRISDILRSLESKKLIQRMTDPEDNRRVRVYVTEKGKDFAKEKHDLMKKRLVHLMDFLGEKDAKELIRLMKRIKEYQEQMNQE